MEFDTILPPQTNFPRISAENLSFLAAEAFKRLSFTFPRSHLLHLVSIVQNPHSSAHDRLIASYMLKNALVAARGKLALCQDTGTAQVFAWKDEGIILGSDGIEALSQGIARTWKDCFLRNSTLEAKTFFSEVNPGTNLPAQIHLCATFPKDGKPALRFLFCAKGGGSSNKTNLVQATPALLDPQAFQSFLEKQIASLGVAACPPYSIAVVAGGISPEQNLLALKLATCGYFDKEIEGFDTHIMGVTPTRDKELESTVLSLATHTGLGAQFGGTALAISARVLRLPRHGASFPVSIGVSCSAHRNLYAVIDHKGIHLQSTVQRPEEIPGLLEAASLCASQPTEAVRVDTSIGLIACRDALASLSTGTQVLLSGKILVARDAAHARWRALLREGKPLPEYLQHYIIMYAGPAETPDGYALGSFGPTTAGRMDEYADELMRGGAALVTLAKGNRSAQWTAACKQWNAVYLGSPGGIAALISENHISASEILDYPELGMEAVRLVTVKNLPCFVLTNGRGDDFYSML